MVLYRKNMKNNLNMKLDDKALTKQNIPNVADD